LIAASTIALFVACAFVVWLIAPVLNHVTVVQWRIIGLLAIAAMGLMTHRTLATGWIAVSAAVGILLGGALASQVVPNDMRASAFESLRFSIDYWREACVGAVTSTASVLVFKNKNRSLRPSGPPC
jgi:hypothetical protein